MSRKNRIIVALSVGGLVWLGFWLLYGHDLTYDVFSGDTYWYTERFSLRGKLIVTSVLAFFAAGAVWLCLPKKSP